MNKEQFINSLHQYGADSAQVCLNMLGIDGSAIQESVILSPGWYPERIFPQGAISEVTTATPLYQYKIWNVALSDHKITYVKTGFGAPVVMDSVLLMALTGACKRMLFVSSVGSLSEDYGIGDIVIPQYSASGDGASRYLSDVMDNDIFEEGFVK